MEMENHKLVLENINIKIPGKINEDSKYKI